VLFSILRDDTAHVACYALDTAAQEILVEDARFPRYLSPGYLLYTKRYELRADTFDPARRRLGGEPVILDERPSINPWSGKVELAVGQDGTLLYGKEFRPPRGRTLVWVDRQGVETPTGFGPNSYGHIAMSPSGSKVAIETYGDRLEMWLGDTQTETKIRFDPASGFNPIWSHDGKEIIWGSDEALTLSRRAADGSGPVEEMNATGLLRSTTPDGHVVVMRQGQATNWDLWLVPPEGEPVPFIVEPGMQLGCAFSRDGKWVAYRSIGDGRIDLFVRPYPNLMDGKLRVSGGGRNPSRPIWSADGSELFFIMDGAKLMAAPVTTTPELVVGEPKVLYADLNARLDAGTEYAPMPDGQRFLVIKEDPGFLEPRTELNVVLNWIEVVKAKMGR
jgi:hypothetical protein